MRLISVCPSLSSLSAIFGLVYRPRDFASYLLGIFICNLLLYLAFYIIMKVMELVMGFWTLVLLDVCLPA